MPVPILMLGAKLAAWASSALASYGLYAMWRDASLEQLERVVMDWVVEQAAARAGLQLDPDSPWSDASIAGAVGQKVGIPFRSFRDPEMIREDLDGYATGLISQKSGYVVRSVQNVAMLREDFLRIGAAELSARLGLPAGVMPEPGAQFDPVAIREQLLIWAKAELMAQVNESVQIGVNDLLTSGALDEVVNDINSQLAAVGSIENISARQLAVRLANDMATNAVVDFQKFAGSNSKRSRRQESLRAAQAKFRARHGNRQIYVPLGMTSTVG